jgi:hypothetical protein
MSCWQKLCVNSSCALKNAVFSDMTPNGFCENRHFGGTYRLHHPPSSETSVLNKSHTTSHPIVPAVKISNLMVNSYLRKMRNALKHNLYTFAVAFWGYVFVLLLSTEPLDAIRLRVAALKCFCYCPLTVVLPPPIQVWVCSSSGMKDRSVGKSWSWSPDIIFAECVRYGPKARAVFKPVVVFLVRRHRKHLEFASFELFYI